MDLSGKIALVTGASRGLGAAIAIELAKRGATLFITWTPSDRSIQSAKQVLQDIKAFGGEASGIAVDLGKPESAAQVVDECVKNYSHIDILVNNAGVDLFGPIADVKPVDFRKVMDLNVMAVFFMCQAAIPHLRRPGRIINMSSIAARCGVEEGVVYCASKGAVEGMTRSLAATIGAEGHTVNCVEPGPTQSEMMDRLPKELVEKQKAATPVENRVGTPDDIAQVVAFLAGESSRWISGQSINASGGFSMI